MIKKVISLVLLSSMAHAAPYLVTDSWPTTGSRLRAVYIGAIHSDHWRRLWPRKRTARCIVCST